MAEDTRQPIDPINLAWLAGWLEGEGCFQQRDPSPEYPGGYITVMAVSTDRDTILRARAVAGVGTISVRKKQAAHHKDAWNFGVWRREDVLWLVEQLYPLMGERRRAAIEAQLRSPEHRHPRHKKHPCGTAAKYSRGCRCADCTRANTDRCRAYRHKRARQLADS